MNGQAQLRKQGFLLVELVIAAGLIGLIFVSVFFLQSKLLQIKQDGITKTKAVYRAEEALEAVRWIRNANGWEAIENLDEGDDYCLTQPPGGNEWTLDKTTPCSLLDGVFVRTLRFDKAYRQNDDKGPISTSGWEDPGTRKVTVIVSWEEGLKSILIDTYFTDWAGAEI
ncbi:MAG: hypothetical protein A3G60_01240 [Candidatus Ryanbacteria bacterium RIFCSPLOWO2_12_FULL_47_9c]|uniref:Type II secretion system protein GspI C-terminal domain-containing protein n=2 Tax=Candidatus Ryaniibacteriota TaxID=1817914 RepID=A0A1G2H7N6_9BACT|nr:MAG: hypothetical protein UY14_C0021G0005 [Parcubacteria group bacterium GW2011_GWA1_47_9]OGZ55235.1 MAG: hypothetical protein A3J04_02195 [Candidatus Ryanbacteria bacterium RIFCSPLOWO2_02_FULL_47_14]OGZ57958.1 MAG: hypothetical protein A3G60_01240 [Candidatus Ryanbacteria bacterium RIFCSPLOWO2_12_FULL_47_9c]